MRARRSGQCPYCEKPIVVGDEIVTGRLGWGHIRCANTHIPKCNRCGGVIMRASLDTRGICGDCQEALKQVKEWTPERVIEWLDVDNHFLEKALLRLWERQTSDEQLTEDTRYLNGVGFSAADAKRLSKAAQWISGGKHLDGWHLEQARKRMKKYSRQLCEIIKERGGNATTTRGNGADRPAGRKGRRGKIKVDFGGVNGNCGNTRRPVANNTAAVDFDFQ